MSPMLLDPPLPDLLPSKKISTSSTTSVVPAEHASKRISACSDTSVIPPEHASSRVKELWWLHGHPHSKRYADPKLVSLAALVRHNGEVYACQPAFLYPATADARTPYAAMTWLEFDRVTDSLAATYGRSLREELAQANASQQQPTVALLGGGTTLEYFCTELALQKLGVRVLLLAEANAVSALHHLLDVCKALVVITDSKNAGADTNLVRKLSMVEELPKMCKSRMAEVGRVKFQDFGDVWERHSFIIHSSGSTGVPKPIIHTNRSMMLIARMYRLFQEFEIKNWFLLFPLYHIAGISIALSGVPNGQILSFPPLIWPPSSSGIFAAWQTLADMNHPVDITHCAPTLIENMYEYIMDTSGDFSPLKSLKILQPGGAALSDSIVEALTNRGVNVKTTYGSTEIGPPFRTIPHTRDNVKCYSFRNLYPDNGKLKMEKVGEGYYELVVYKGFELAAELWEGKPDNEPYRTNDLFTQDPPGSGFYVLHGRRDDMLVHSNGLNTSAGSLQLDIQSSSRIIQRALVLGHSKPSVALLVEVSQDHDPTHAATKFLIWEAVERVNDRYPSHSRIIRSMIYVLPKGESLPVTPKGNVRRKEAERLFSKNIEQLYRSDHIGSPNGLQASEMSLEEYIRHQFSVLSSVPIEEISAKTTLHNLCIDSRQALSLRASLSSRLGPVSLSTIFENTSVGQLTSALYLKDRAIDKEPRDQVINRMISKYSAEIRSWPIGRSKAHSYPAPKTETILLTGASGSVGTALLDCLSSSPKVSKIYALLRGTDKEAKLRSALSSRGLDATTILGTQKIEFLDYDMGDPLLGLAPDVYERLAQNVTIIIHNAWKVDFNIPVEGFEDDCIKSTLSLLHLTQTARPKTLAFTSSISTCLGALALTPSPAPIPESPLPTPLTATSHLSALATGYAHSKFITEHILLSASTSLPSPTPILILRLGQLTAHSSTAYWSKSDMYPILIKSSLHLNALPALSAPVDWLPLDIAAMTIRDLLLPSSQVPTSQTPPYKVHNIVNPTPTPWPTFLTYVRHALLPPQTSNQNPALLQLPTIPMRDWVARLNALADSGADAETYPGLKLLGFWEGMVHNAVEVPEGENGWKENGDLETVGNKSRFETGGTEAASESLRGCLGFRREWIEGCVERWRAEGWLRVSCE